MNSLNEAVSAVTEDNQELRKSLARLEREKQQTGEFCNKSPRKILRDLRCGSSH